MRKEILFAIILGIGLGVAVAFGAWRANLAFKKDQKSPLAQTSTAPGSTNQNLGDLVLTEPEENSITNSDKIMVKGSTYPNSNVVILTDTGEKLLLSGKDGEFESEISLNAGPNQISIHSYDDNGTDASKTIMIVYSTEFPE